MDIVARTTDCGTEAKISAFMHGVVACLAKNDAIVYRVGPTELDVSHVVSLGALAVFVLRTSCFAKANNFGSTTCALELLTNESLLLDRLGKFIASSHATFDALAAVNPLPISNSFIAWR